MRIFFALAFPDKWKAPITALQEKLLQKALRGRAIPVDFLHLTLQFVGEVKDVNPLIERMKRVHLKKVALQGVGLDALRRGGEELIYWRFDETKSLIELQWRIREVLDEEHLAYDKKNLRAHVTLLRKVVWKEKVDLSTEPTPSEIYWPQSVGLYASTLTPRGAFYELIGEFPLCLE